MPKEVSFSMNFESNLKELVKGLEEAKSKIESLRKTSSSTAGGASYPKQWRKGLLPGGMSPEELYMGGQAGSVASGIAKAPRGTGGGGMMGALGLGAVAGAAAGGIVALTKVMSNQLRQSQIMNKFLGTLSKLFGMLIDLVLLPFIPLLVMVILGLTNTILAVGKTWNDWMKGSGVGKAIDKVVNPPEGSTALSRTVDFVSMINELVKAWYDGMKQLILGAALAIGEIGAGVVKFVIELLVNIAGAFRDGWLQFQTIVITAVKTLWNGFNDNFIVPVTNAIKNLGAGFMSLLTTISAWFEGVLSLKWITDPLNTLRDIVIGFITAIYNFIRSIPIIGGFLPSLSSTSSQGTTLTQSNGAASGGNTFVLNGLTSDQLQKQVETILRKLGTRYMA